MTSDRQTDRRGKGCKCEIVNFFNASLIPQPWMQSKKHVPSTLCACGKTYFCYVDDKVYPVNSNQKGQP